MFKLLIIILQDLMDRLYLVIQLPVKISYPIIKYSDNLVLNSQTKERTDIMNECCEKSKGKCNCDGKFKNPTKVRKEKLQEFLKKYSERDLRFAYFRSRRYPSIYITAVSVLDRKTSILKVAFSFSSPKDAFCRSEGKIKCFTKLENPESGHVTQVPWLEDGLLSIYLAYNRIKERPEKLALTKFDDLEFSGRPIATYAIIHKLT